MKKSTLLALVLLNLAILAGIATFSAASIVPQRQNRFDFYPHWVAGRAVWAGETPYQPAVTERIQRGMFGTLLPAGTDQHRLVYPAYASLLLGPLVALPANLAIPIWMALQLWAFLVTPLVWLAILRVRPSPLRLAYLLVGLVLVFRYPMIVFVIGQFTGTLLLLLSLGIYLLTRHKDAWAGLAFALATVPPSLSGPLALVLLGAVALRGRWRGLASFLGSLALLTLASSLRIGWWLPDFLTAVGNYSGYSSLVWPPSLLGAPWAAWGFTVLVAGWLLHWLRAYLRAPGSHFVGFSLAALLAALLLLPQTGTYTLSLLIVVLFALSLQPHAHRLQDVLLLGLMLSPWLFYRLGDTPLQLLVLPLLCLLLFQWNGAPTQDGVVDG